MIDAVLTWVDGQDPLHTKKRNQFADPNAHAYATGNARFDSSDEIRFAVLSLLKFCPFLRYIHIVTDAQSPAALAPLLATKGKVRIVDHKDIYGDHADLLPVFSSRSIETMVHRIPGLAEQFIYLCDDFSIARPVQPTEFFENDLPVLQGTLKPLPPSIFPWLRSKLKLHRPGHKRAQQAGARLAGRRGSYLLVRHHPHPMRRSTLTRFFASNPSVLRAQAGHRFRSVAQFSPVSLSNHLEIAAGARIKQPVDVGYIKPGYPTGAALADTMEKLNTGAFSSFCVQSLERMSAQDRQTVLEGLERRYAD